jgi:hypothetical protein
VKRIKIYYRIIALMLLLIGGSNINAQEVSYLWSTGDTTANLSQTPTSTTTYFVTVTQYGQSYVDSFRVEVNLPTVANIQLSACDSMLSPSGSFVWNTTGIYTDTLLNTNGCDSIVTIDLTINNSAFSVDSMMFCSSGNQFTNAGQLITSAGVYTDTLSSASGCDSIITTHVFADTTAPTLITQNITVYLDANGLATIAANQIDNGSFDNCGIDSISLDIAAFSCADTGNNIVQVTATDFSGNVSNSTATVTVLDTNAPLVSTQNITLYLDQNGSASLTATDVDNGTSDNCGVQSISISQLTFDCSNTGTNTLIFSAVDIHGNSASDLVEIIVLDTISPTILVQSDTIYLNQNGTANISLADIDAGSFDNCGIANSMIFPNSFSCAHANTLQTIYCSVTDSSGNNAATSVQVFIADTLAPVISTDSMVAYLDQSGNASISTSDLISNISDNCGVDSVWLDTNAFDCTAANSYQTVFAFAIDGSNNVSSMMTQVLVLDTITPIVNAVSNITVYLDANGNASLTPADVENGSTDNCGIANQQLSQASFDCADQGMNEATYTVADLSGNTSSTMVVVNVIDNINSITGFTSANSAPTNSMRTYSVDSIANATYFWSVTNGVINAQSGASANVTWYNYSSGTIQVIQTTSNGCSDTLIQDIVLWPLGIATMAAQPFEVSLYPNPARESINLELTRFEKASSLNNIKIFDVAGNIVLSQEKVLMQLGEAHQIETRALAKGVYFLTLENELATETLRFILQ